MALSLPVVESDPGTISDSESHEILPVTSFACQWNVPRKRKESSAKISDLTFKKHVYGCQRKHTLSSLSDFDPRPVEYKGTAPTLLQSFLASVKGRGLGVSVLFDKDTQVWTDQDASVETPSRGDLMERVSAFKESLHVSPERIRQIERETKDQSQSALWYSARRYRLTASVFGKVYQRLPSTPPDSLVKGLLHPQQFSTKAME